MMAKGSTNDSPAPHMIAHTLPSVIERFIVFFFDVSIPSADIAVPVSLFDCLLFNMEPDIMPIVLKNQHQS